MRNRVVVALALSGLLALLLAACGGLGGGTGSAPQSVGRPDLIGGIAAPSAPFKDTTSSQGLPSTDRIIVRNVDMTLVVNKPSQSLQDVSRMASELGGYVVSSWVSAEQEATPSAFVSIRVPADRLEAALVRLRALAVRVPREQSNSQDVTEEHVDLQARLKSLEATEAQLLKLMGRAEKVDEVLTVQRELTNVQGQIESLKGRIQYLERTSAMALVSVSLVAQASEAPLVTPGWSALEVLKDAVRGLTGVAQGVANGAIWVAIFTPLWLPPVVVAAWLARRWLRRPRPS